MGSKLKVYEYAKCSTCRNALKFLDARKVEYEKVPIVENPPSRAELKKMVQYLGGDFKKLFNTSGELYREMGLSAKVKNMSEDEAVALLAKHGKLVKRPFALAPTAGTVGFKEADWKKFLETI